MAHFLPRCPENTRREADAFLLVLQGSSGDGSDSSGAAGTRDDFGGRVEPGRGNETNVGEDEGEDGDGDEAEEQSIFLFSSENWRWPSWMPGLHLEVIRRRSLDEGSVSNLQAQVFGMIRTFSSVTWLRYHHNHQLENSATC